MSQIDLLTGEPVPEAERAPKADRLTPRQAFALEMIGSFQPITSDELGALWCEHRGKHTFDTRCDWDAKAGRDMGDALRKRGLVVRKRTVGWCLTGYRPGPAGTGSGIDPKTSDWPKGF